MRHPHREHRSRDRFGTPLLAAACCVGAVAYALFVGPAMLPPQEAEPTTAANPDTGAVVEETEEPEQSGPIGFLEIHVSDRDRAWVQTLQCTGDLSEDHAACTALAEAAAEINGDDPEDGAEPDYPRPAPADGSDAELLFTEVSEGTVCTDNLYGPQEATVEGIWEGEEIETTLNRQGSCEEARWQRLSPLTEQLS